MKRSPTLRFHDCALLQNGETSLSAWKMKIDSTLDGGEEMRGKHRSSAPHRTGGTCALLEMPAGWGFLRPL